MKTNPTSVSAMARMELQVMEKPTCQGSIFSPLLDPVQVSLNKVEKNQQLPSDYTEEGTGRWGRWKNWFRRKLLNSFKISYVDVI